MQACFPEIFPIFQEPIFIKVSLNHCSFKLTAETCFCFRDRSPKEPAISMQNQNGKLMNQAKANIYAVISGFVKR